MLLVGSCCASHTNFLTGLTWPTAPAFGVYLRQDTVIGGRYEIKATDAVMVRLTMLHRDPEVWGDDAEALRPERFSRAATAALPPNA